MKKKLLMLSLAVCLGISTLTACSESSNKDKDEPNKKERDKDANESDEVISSDEDIPVANVDDIIEELKADSKYNDNLTSFQDQFLEYAALCMVYEGSYGNGGFNEQTKVEMIGFSEGMYRVDDSEGVCYDYGLPYIKPDRVDELANRYFGKSLDLSILELEDVNNVDLFFDNEHMRAYADADGGIIVNVGDWGISGPVSKNVDINIDANAITIANTIDMYDFEYDKVAYEIGTYTLVLSYDLENPYNYYITDFYFEKSDDVPSYGEDDENDTSTESIAIRIAEYYNRTYQPEGEYVVFDEETADMGDCYVFIVRYQMSDEEQEERMANGDIPLANVYADSVTVDKVTLVGTNDYGAEVDY